MPDALERLRRELLAFAAGYPGRWRRSDDLGAPPLGRLVRAFFAAEIRGAPGMSSAARRLGADLRERHGYTTPDDADEASADCLRGLACIAAEALHGAVCTDFGAGDRLTAEQVAFYVADDWWPGRDDRPTEEWPDIRRVREQLMLDALDVPVSERADVLGFAAAFIGRHPALVREAAWGLRTVGSVEGFEEAVWTATGEDEIWRGVYFFAEGILARLPDEARTH
jgi:hypothetical protein